MNMPPRRPIAQLPTHEVANTPPHLGDQDLWSQDIVLQEGVLREGAAGSVAKLAQFGKDAGRAEVMEQADEANRHAPELRAFDRYGMRINEVRFHPSYHALQDLAVSNGLSNHAWRNPGPGAHVTHAALNYMLNQMEGGVMCPLAMSYAAVPALRTTPDVAEDWVRGLLSQRYDRRDIPASEKTGLQMGMFMTEKQGGSDVRANSTQAVPDGAGYRLTGHKFFCSAPMSDAFLTLAYAPGGLSCFLVPRFTPDGARNRFYLQRLKDKLGNRSNASSEMELQDTWGILVGPEGRGVSGLLQAPRSSSLALMKSSICRR
jgi:putative acyl-CoA dehydrogenase